MDHCLNGCRRSYCYVDAASNSRLDIAKLTRPSRLGTLVPVSDRQEDRNISGLQRRGFCSLPRSSFLNSSTAEKTNNISTLESSPRLGWIPGLAASRSFLTEGLGLYLLELRCVLSDLRQPVVFSVEHWE